MLKLYKAINLSILAMEEVLQGKTMVNIRSSNKGISSNRSSNSFSRMNIQDKVAKAEGEED